MNHSTKSEPDHGGNLDAACERFGGSRADWIDLSTGINPEPYPLPSLDHSIWSALPDQSAVHALVATARRFWSVPDHLHILPTNGASASIAALPKLFKGTQVEIPGPTYNEHALAFQANGWRVTANRPSDARVLVHPNNPDGRLWSETDLTIPQMIIDESFADVRPDNSLLGHLSSDRHIVLKSFGKFWGLAGVRLGFAIGSKEIIENLRRALGPWSVSGPGLQIGATALADDAWARATRIRLAEDSQHLDALALSHGWQPIGGTSLFRLYDTADARAAQDALAAHKIWSRTFPYSDRWLRLGLPASGDWFRLETALSK